jgi:dCTP deaminase
MYDEVPFGHHGQLFLELVSRTFPIQVRTGLSLNQLRISAGRPRLSDSDIRTLHDQTPLLFEHGLPSDRIVVENGLFIGLDLGRPRGGDAVGFRAKEDGKLIDLSRSNHYHAQTHWEEVSSERDAIVILHPERFYLLLSKQSIRIPPAYAAEMTAYDPTSGELRTHYAGFFDPGFGHDPQGKNHGARAALEVRAHDVPFAAEHGQNICRLTFEPMLEVPDKLYGSVIGSNYQKQETALSKHFLRERTSDHASPEPLTLF